MEAVGSSTSPCRHPFWELPTHPGLAQLTAGTFDIPRQNLS